MASSSVDPIFAMLHPPASSAETAVADETPKNPSERLQALLKVDFEYQLDTLPEFATQAGFHDYDSCLQRLGPHCFDQKVVRNKQILTELDAIEADGADSLTPLERLHAMLFRDGVEGESRGIELGAHLMPLNSIGNGGVHESFLELLGWMKFETEDDFQTYLDRLMAFHSHVADFIDLLAYGSGMGGRVASRSMMRRVVERLDQLAEGDNAELRQVIEGKEMDPELRENLEKAFETCWRASIVKLRNFVGGFYSTRVREDPGCCALKQGAELYKECLQFHTSTDKSAAEVHEMGLKEVSRIEERFQKDVLDVLEFKGTFSEFACSLKNDPSWFFKTEEELLDGYRSLVENIEAKLPLYFKMLPKTRLEIVPKKSGPAAFYYAGTADGSRPGRFYVNVSRLSERARYEMVALALHEGVPGHHLQGALALENSEIPNFLRYIEDRRYEYGPARRPLHAAYLEGWALYCENLGEEMGMYPTPQDLFGRLSMEMMRAVRLVVDTGIHSLGWSIDKATAYMAEKTGMAAAESSEECHRYAAWPGQACAYKVGQLAIEEMRAMAQETLGDSKFDLKEFHHTILRHGPLPLGVLRKLVAEWAAKGGA